MGFENEESTGNETYSPRRRRREAVVTEEEVHEISDSVNHVTSKEENLEADSENKTETAPKHIKTIAGENNRRQKRRSEERVETVAGSDNRRRKRESQNIYNQIVNNEFEGDGEKLMYQINSALYRSKKYFDQDVEKIRELVGQSGKKYIVDSLLTANGGEATLLLCKTEEDEKVVAKVYYDIDRRYNEDPDHIRKLAIVRSAVINFTRNTDSPNILPIQDIGLVELVPDSQNYFEVQPYCEEGDLSQKGEHDFEQVCFVAKEVNEGLHAIHEGGLLHMDIKPDNLYYRDGHVVISDFGVANIQTDGRNVTRTTAGADGYRAPETTIYTTADNNKFYITTASDYYSLGVTLASLYAGNFIFKDKLSQIPLAMNESHLPLPFKEDPNHAKLQYLVDRLYQLDPKHRFNYDDVNAWLNNPVDHGMDSFETRKSSDWRIPYPFMDCVCHNEEELFQAITDSKNSWDFAVKQLYTGIFYNRFESNPTVQTYALMATEDILDNDVGLFCFLKNIYRPGSLAWQGETYDSLSSLAHGMLNDEIDTGKLLSNHLISHWLRETPDLAMSDDDIIPVEKIESLSEESPDEAKWWFIHAYQKTEYVEFLGKNIRSIAELYDTILENPGLFYESGGVLDLLSDPISAAPLNGMLDASGYHALVTQYCKELKSYDRSEQAQRVLAFLEQLALNEKDLDVDTVRQFYSQYGPFSYLDYFVTLAVDEKTYIANTPGAEKLLKEIRSYTGRFNVGSIQDRLSSFSEMTHLYEQFNNAFLNNPFLLELGLFQNKTIFSRRLEGYMGYDFLGKKVPLGFENRIKVTRKEE